MHFALPPRKTSQPPPYARGNTSGSATYRRRKQLQVLSYAVLGLLTFYLVLKLVLYASSAGDNEDGPSTIEGSQDIVLVTVFDNETMSEDYMRIVKVNRDDYAARHGWLQSSRGSLQQELISLQDTGTSTPTPAPTTTWSTLHPRRGR